MQNTIKLNLGCGEYTHPEFVNCDIKQNSKGNVNMLFDLDKFPYPFKDNSVDIIVVSGVIAHLKHPIKFHKELNRIMKKEGSEAYILSCTCKCSHKNNVDVFIEKYIAHITERSASVDMNGNLIYGEETHRDEYRMQKTYDEYDGQLAMHLYYKYGNTLCGVREFETHKFTE